MNIPIGAVEKEHLDFAETAPFSLLKQLMGKGFNGYIVATIEGITGLEEGLLMIRENVVVGAVFDALRVNKQTYGVPAIRLVFNLLKAKKGVFDVNKLSKQQIDLIMAFNEKIKLAKDINVSMISKLEPAAYRPEVVSKELALDLKSKDNKYHILKRFGLGSI